MKKHKPVKVRYFVDDSKTNIRSLIINTHAYPIFDLIDKSVSQRPHHNSLIVCLLLSLTAAERRTLLLPIFTSTLSTCLQNFFTEREDFSWELSSFRKRKSLVHSTLYYVDESVKTHTHGACHSMSGSISKYFGCSFTTGQKYVLRQVEEFGSIPGQNSVFERCHTQMNSSITLS